MQRDVDDFEKTIAATVSAVEERLGVMLGVPLPTQAERIMEAKRLEMIGVRERVKRTRKLPREVRKVCTTLFLLIVLAVSPAEQRAIPGCCSTTPSPLPSWTLTF
jgi:hypothetical protein